MKDIIFVSFEFPPLNTGGVFRSLGFAKYLPEFGIRPHIYTLHPKCYEQISETVTQDLGLLKSIEGRDIKINYVPIGKYDRKRGSPIRRLRNSMFNLYRGWEYKAWRQNLLKRIMQDAVEINFDYVLITAPPFGMVRLGYEISKLLNLPLVLDMRDAWSLWTAAPYRSYFHYKATLRLERKYFNYASAIIATSEQTIRDWKNLHPCIQDSNFHCITNGYDDASGALNFSSFSIPTINKTTLFKIAYVGSFYYTPFTRNQMILPFYQRKGHRKLHYYPRIQDWLYRSPYFFFSVLSRVFELKPDWKKKIRIQLAGRQESWLNEMIIKFKLQEVVEQRGFLSHADALSLQKQADALLITSAKVYGGKDCFIAGKTFEYIAMKKPIFAFVAEGAQKEILEKTGLSLFFDPDQVEVSASKFINILSGGETLTPNIDFVDALDRKRLTEKLSKLLA